MVAIIPNTAFDQVPANARPPGAYFEVDDSLAGLFQRNQLILVIGQRLAGGAVAAATPTLISGGGAIARTYFGNGSLLARMIEKVRLINETNTLWAIALDDDGAGVAASQTVTVTGAATSAGTIALYIGLDRITVGVAAGDAAPAVATAIETAIAAAAGLPVTAAVGKGDAANVVTVSFRHKGEAGNDLKLGHGLRGVLGGEALPAGISLTIGGEGYLAGGIANPALSAAIAAMGDHEYDFIIHPYTDDANMDALDAELTRRWDAIHQIYGLAFSSRKGSLSELSSFGANRNNRYHSVIEASRVQGPAYERAAKYGAWVARSIGNHPARPLHTLTLFGEMARAVADEFTWNDRQTLLFTGVATTEPTPDGQAMIGRAVTTYRRNQSGDPDPTWLDITTPATLMAIVRRLRFVVNREYIERRVLLVDDGTRISTGVPHTTPKKVKARLVAHYREMELLGFVENAAEFEANTVVSRDPDDPTRLNVIYTPDLANPLMIFAAKVQFRLRFPLLGGV